MSDLWDSPDSGLKENFDGTIGECRWTQFEGGNFSLDLQILADDGDTVFVRGLGAGKNWTSYDGGESIQGASATAKFHAKTGMWKWISAAVKAGAGDVLRKADAELGGGQGRTYAAAWNGLRFHFDVVQELGAVRQDDGSFKDELRDVIRPTAYLGSGTPNIPATNGNGNSIESVLKPVAQAAADYGQFADLAMEVIQSSIPPAFHKDAYVQIADKAYYESLRS